MNKEHEKARKLKHLCINDQTPNSGHLEETEK